MTQHKVPIGFIIAGNQPSSAEAELQQEGIRSIVNLRLPHEESEGLNPDQESRLAAELGLAFVHLPIAAEKLSEMDVQALQDVIAALPAPVYVHCGLGQRAATLSLLASADSGTSAVRIVKQAEAGGIDISPAVHDFIARYLESRKTEREEDEISFYRAVR
ncbi:MAG TPA: sulfur transferase domain-containing protein [Dongiaceae bacterium]|jgi:uncharacterized protein (TIGR01244 family)|nr:sulfur transferase domain-containing protein [Dongiaceae bacterium]